MRLRDIVNKAETEYEKQHAKTEWFGFHAPEHSYDPSNIRFDVFNRHAWSWFCEYLMTPAEWNEYVAISIWEEENGWPAVTYGTPPALQKEAEKNASGIMKSNKPPKRGRKSWTERTPTPGPNGKSSTGIFNASWRNRKTSQNRRLPKQSYRGRTDSVPIGIGVNA